MADNASTVMVSTALIDGEVLRDHVSSIKMNPATALTALAIIRIGERAGSIGIVTGSGGMLCDYTHLAYSTVRIAISELEHSRVLAVWRRPGRTNRFIFYGVGGCPIPGDGTLTQLGLLSPSISSSS